MSRFIGLVIAGSVPVNALKVFTVSERHIILGEFEGKMR